MRACTCRSPPPSVIINIVITSERAVLAIASVTVWDFVLGVHDHTHTRTVSNADGLRESIANVGDNDRQEGE